MDSSLFQGGALLMAGGFLLNWLRGIPGRIYDLFLHWFTVTVDCPGHRWPFTIANYMLGSMTPIGGHRSIEAAFCPDSDMIPGIAPGSTFYWYKGRLLKVTKFRKELEGGGTPVFERIVLRFFFGRSTDVEDFFREGTSEYERQVKKGTRQSIYTHIGETNIVSFRKRRSPDSVILGEGVYEKLRNHIEGFLKSEDWHRESGIPYRTGILIHGKPGNGKTSLIRALAANFSSNIRIISLGSKKVNDATLQNTFNLVQKGDIVVMEDIDCMFVAREQGEAGVTFSGLLNALDGIASNEGYVLVMTTNHPERLDPALIRPGRIDLICEIGNAVREQAVRYFNRFYGSGHEDLATQFGDCFPECAADSPHSMAWVQNHLMSHRDSPATAVSELCETLSESA